MSEELALFYDHGSACECVKKPIGINGGRIKNNLTALQLQTFAIEAVRVSKAKGLHSLTPLSVLVFLASQNSS